MGDEEYEKELPGSCEGGGYSIFLDEKDMYAFMEEGDFSSSRNLDHFLNVETSIEKRLVEGKGFTILAMSMPESRISRDFSVLQIAHLLSRNGKKVNIVDCDFFDPGMNGLVQNIEDHGFLDLLLYGSSLKSVMKPTGIDGVYITGAGSFPVSRTIPFALKEFGKVNEYLSSNSDVVIYCSTLYTDDNSVNPLPQFVDSILFCCSIDKMEEGELQKILKDIGPDLPPSDLVCFCSAKESRAAISGEETRDDDIMDLEPESEILDHDSEDDDVRPEFIEKTEEIDSVGRKEKRWISFPRLVTFVISAMIVIFIVWWVSIDKSVQEKEGTDRMSELILKQQDARDLAQKDDLQQVQEQTGVSPAAGVEDPGSSVEDAARLPSGEAGSQAADDLDLQKDPGEGSSAVRDSVEQKTLAPEGTCYSVHIASFLDIQRAGTESDFFEKKDYDVRVVEVMVNGKKWYRVFIGEYETLEEAEAMKTELLSFRRIREARVLNVKYD
ncbi:MAG: SPOR domain-containing protein [Candidatus Krumholzibacteriota bacterium]|nr:SPOR domain-containing protein [Candidatus Krumholzibacteriota bacterium]